MGAQKFRTPKGLDYLKKLSNNDSQQVILALLQSLFQVYTTIWMEGVWEILCCDNSPTKFIVTDNPLTTYNKGLFPQSRQCVYPQDAPVELLGTHTIFPLSMNRCLVITNLGYVRNPWANPIKPRENPRVFSQTLFNMRKIQVGRQISEQEVIAINYIMKTRAKRYVAAPKRDWLHPENFLKSMRWDKLSNNYFPMPDPRKMVFHSETIVGFSGGGAWGMDEYGRNPTAKDAGIKDKRGKEWITFQRHKKMWESKFGKLTRAEMDMY